MGWRSACRTSGRSDEGSGGKLIAALRWSLTTYDQWRAAKDQADLDGSDIPEALQPPDIIDGYGVWYEDFWRLSTERQFGMGIGPIPASMIDRHTVGWDEEDAEAFEHCIRKMDEVYLMSQNKADQSPPADPTVSAHEAWRAATRSQRKR